MKRKTLNMAVLGIWLCLAMVFSAEAQQRKKQGTSRKKASPPQENIKQPDVGPHPASQQQKEPPPQKNIATEIPDDVKKEIEALNSSDPVQRMNTTLNLGRMGERAAPAIPYLIRMLGDQNGIVVNTGGFTIIQSPGQAAGEALGAIGEPAIAPLSAAMKGGDPIVAYQALRALGKIKHPRAGSVILGMIKDKDSRVRASAADTLTWSEDPLTIKGLIEALKDKELDVRRAAAGSLVQRSLKHTSDSSAIGPLILALRDEDSRVRLNAAWALGEMKDTRAVDPLITTLKDVAPDVRSFTARALQKITGEQFGEDQAKWQEWREKK